MAVLKTSTGRLYLLFDSCLPNNNKVKKRLAICRVTESQEYNQLKMYAPFNNRFGDFFSTEKLNEYSLEKLDEISRVVPMIVPVVEKLLSVIAYGDVSGLTKDDIPDFSSEKSIKAFDKLCDEMSSNTPNITNISNPMDIFSSQTAKNAGNILRFIPMGKIENVADLIPVILPNLTYCISTKDIADVKAKYIADVKDNDEKINALQKAQWRLSHKKWLYISIAVILLAIMNSFELVTPGCALVLNILSAILMIVYLLLG